MGLLDSVIGGLMGNAVGGSSPIAGVLTNLLSGNGQASNPAAGNAPAGQGAGVAAAGLPGIITAFEQAGLGHVVQSWIGNGPNQPTSPQQLQNVLGQDQVQGMANQAGLQPNELLTQLAQHLPALINAMTPNGHVPEGNISV